MIKIITAMNNPILNEELKNENNIKIICKDIFYKEGILEILEKDLEVNYIIMDFNLPGEIEINELIEKILYKNEKIKIIITIKNENKNNINLDNNKIKIIYYQNKINLEILKKYNNDFNKINIKNKKEKNKNKKIKIISILGEEKIGKSITIINMAHYLKSKNFKTLIIELNSEHTDISTLFKNEKKSEKNITKKLVLKNKIKIINNKYIVKYLNKKIIENMIIKINKNIDLILYNKIINYNLIKKIENNYDYFLIEFFPKINKKILFNSDEKILLIKPNLFGIKNAKKIIDKNKIENLKIIINNFNEYSIDEKIINEIFNKNKIIAKIKYKKEYEELINKKFKSKILDNKNYKKDFELLMRKII